MTAFFIKLAILLKMKLLIIYLELISWKSVADIMGDKKVLKKIMKVDEGFDRPTEGKIFKRVPIIKENLPIIARC